MREHHSVDLVDIYLEHTYEVWNKLSGQKIREKESILSFQRVKSSTSTEQNYQQCPRTGK
jgi:hypothetical protein